MTAALLLLAVAGAVVVYFSGDIVAPPRITLANSSHPFLGVVLRRSKTGPGVEVWRVLSPAREAGIRAGDRILRVDGEPVGDGVAFDESIRDGQPGQLVRLEGRRPDPAGGGGAFSIEVSAVGRPASPLDLGLSFEEVTFRNPWQLTLRGWYVPPPDLPGSGRAPAVAYGHGSGTDRRDWLYVAGEVHDAGFAQLFFDFAGRGESDGEVITVGAREAGDLRSALEYLLSRREVDPTRLALAGRGMGAVAAIIAASEDARARALVLDSPFADLPRVVGEAIAAYGLPVRLVLPPLLAIAGWRADFDPHAVRPVDSIHRVHVPVLLFHGQADTVVAIAHSQDLKRAAGGPVSFVPMVGLDHNSPRPPDFEEKVALFLSRSLGPGRDAGRGP